MKRAVLLSALALAATFGSSFTSEAEARGFHRHRFHVGFVRVAPVYPVYTGYCRWYRTPYGAVRRCFY